MQAKDREYIRRNYMELMQSISSNVDEVCGHLHALKIISPSMKGNITELQIPGRKKAMKLLDLIVTRGPYAYEGLYRAVLKEQLYDAADILRPNSSPHGPQPDFSAFGQSTSQDTEAAYDSPDEPLPDTWPDRDSIESVGNLRIVEPKHSRMRKLFKYSLTPEGKESLYQMKHQKRGSCLVFNNETFLKLQNRDGTLNDRKGVENLFRSLGFDVTVYSNKTRDEMWELMKEEANKGHSKADCFVMFIFSHGHTGVVFGTDGEKDEKGQLHNTIEIQEIRNLFCRVPSLRGKPKLFFIQACQGDMKDEGQEAHDGGTKSRSVTDVPGSLAEASFLPSTKLQNEEIVQDVKQTLKNLTEDQTDASGEKTPTQADVYIAMATTADYVSWRNTVHGSWFVQAVVYILGRYAHKHELNRLMTMVNNLVSKAETKDRQIKQIGDRISTLRKDFYFFPGLHEETS